MLLQSGLCDLAKIGEQEAPTILTRDNWSHSKATSVYRDTKANLRTLPIGLFGNMFSKALLQSWEMCHPIFKLQGCIAWVH
jgi:hypothetical protein